MMPPRIPAKLQPDQNPERWDDHVLVYEQVFEPFSSDFAATAIRALDLPPGARCLDVGCGTGWAALMMAAAGIRVDAIDASKAMIERVRNRADQCRLGDKVQAAVMDGQALTFADASFDAAISVFGVILFPDAVRGLAELRRVVRPGGKIVVVTWTDPQNFELAAELRAAIVTVKPDQLPAGLPAQLRFRELDDFRALHEAAGLPDVKVEKHTAQISAPSARWLAEHIAFAPGMAAAMGGLGPDAPTVLEEFVQRVEARQGQGPVALKGTAFIGISSAI
jgi:ubiquinone/menaquinone biosynthesis C-methylase UbiE